MAARNYKQEAKWEKEKYFRFQCKLEKELEEEFEGIKRADFLRWAAENGKIKEYRRMTDMYIIKNEWDKEFKLEGTLEDVKKYFELEDAEDIEDVLEHINGESGNGSKYYLEE